jgi:hypothetical protein
MTAMNVRPFDWRDLPALHRTRHKSVFLNTSLLLTRGPLIMPGAVFSFLASTMGVFTSVLREDEKDSNPVIGQFIHQSGTPFSHLTFLTPDEALDTLCVRMLVEYMMVHSGERGAMRLLAEVDEGSLAFESLRHAGFGVYTRQRVWQITGSPPERFKTNSWRAAGTMDELPVRILYNNLVPGLVQQVEPFSTQRPRGMVYYGQGDLLAYVELKYGHRGIWAQPFVHPDAPDMVEYFLDLLCKIPNRRSRPVYVCVRSYQSWLEAAIEDMGAEAGPRQAVLAKQLAAPKKVRQLFALPALEGGQPEISTPMARVEAK